MYDRGFLRPIEGKYHSATARLSLEAAQINFLGTVKSAMPATDQRGYHILSGGGGGGLVVRTHRKFLGRFLNLFGPLCSVKNESM